MNKAKGFVNHLRMRYPKGTRVKLVEMGADEKFPVEPGTTGTVWAVDDSGTIHVNWDNGRGLGLIVGVDEFVTID